LAAAEDGILPPGIAALKEEVTATPARQSAGQGNQGIGQVAQQAVPQGGN
jgi:hypothetical protein